MFKSFAEPIILSENIQIDPFEKGVDILKRALFSKQLNPLDYTSTVKRAELFLKICDVLGIKENDLSISNSDGLPLNININAVPPKNAVQ